MQMSTSGVKTAHPEVSSRLQVLMLLRVIVVSLLLGALIIIQGLQTDSYFGDIQALHYLLIAAVYFASFVYVVWLKYSQKIILQVYTQLFFDSIFITALIYSTGGIESIFSFLYILSIISGSIIAYRKGGLITASANSILYGLLLDLHYYGVVHPLGSQASYADRYQSAYLFFVILANMVGFYLAAYLSSFLSEQVRKSGVALEEKQVDFDRLEALNESIINSISAGLVVLDSQNNIILFNPTAEKFFGAKANHVYGRAITEILPLLGIALPNETLENAAFDQNRSTFSDLTCSRADGKKFYLRLSISPLSFSSGGNKGKILIFQDVTQAKETEEEMKKVEGLAVIGELAAGIAHEIRNPMASISGSIELLKEGLEKDDVNNRLMNIVWREINRLNSLVNDFLLFARPKKANLREFGLGELILESLELFQNSNHWSEGQTAHADFPHPIRLESDPGQLKQVLWNLFSNAADSMGAQGCLYVTGEITSEFSIPGRKRVKIVVRDTGQGFDKKTLPQIFTPFFTTKEKGSGLGMAIVKRIVEGLKGEVYGDNHPEGGGRVTIYLPISN